MHHVHVVQVDLIVVNSTMGLAPEENIDVITIIIIIIKRLSVVMRSNLRLQCHSPRSLCCRTSSVHLHCTLPLHRGLEKHYFPCREVILR
jgi:hypothetical protein